MCLPSQHYAQHHKCEYLFNGATIGRAGCWWELHCVSLAGRHYEKRLGDVKSQHSLSSLCLSSVSFGSSSSYVRIPRNSSPGLTFRALASFTIVTRERFRLPLSIAPTNVTCNPANSANRS